MSRYSNKIGDYGAPSSTRLSKDKAPGLSGLPVGAYLASPRTTEDLIELVQFIFRHGAVPSDMVVGEFVMLWKSKGSADDLTQYQAVCLEEVGLKLVASIMLARLSVEVGESHGASKTQEGSRKGKESPSQAGLFANIRYRGANIGTLGLPRDIFEAFFTRF